MTSEPASPMTPSPPAPRRNNWLIASAALNMFLLGGIAAAVLFGPHRPPRSAGFGSPPPMHDGGPGRSFAYALSPAGRAKVMAMRAEDEAGINAQLSALRDARRAMDQAFVAEPFDRAAFDAAFARLRAAEAAMSARMGERVAALAGALSPEDRRAFVRSLPRMPFGPVGPGGPAGPHGPGIGGGPPSMPEPR